MTRSQTWLVSKPSLRPPSESSIPLFSVLKQFADSCPTSYWLLSHREATWEGFMTVYTGRTFQTCALRVWGIWVSMRDFHAATVKYKRDLPPLSPIYLATVKAAA